MKNIIEPRLLKGFRDFLPDQEINRKLIISSLEESFASFGFVPIDTPILEYTEVLLGKGGGETDKQVYRFTDHGDRDVAMRFDLTVPFARFMAAHSNELYTPFRRYHIGKVFRGENTQRGRYREFTQCDFDIVGPDSVSADFEILLLIQRSLKNLGVKEFHIRLSHRGLFNRFLDHIGLKAESEEILRTVDKLSKIGKEKTLDLLEELGGREAAEKILKYIQKESDAEQTLAKMIELSGGQSEESNRLKSLLAHAKDLGLENYLLDPSITRGLDYYTGTVFETFLDKLPSIGSVCSGGRYNNLASLYTKERLPGVGASVGLDRLIAALEQLEEAGPESRARRVLVFCLEERFSSHYHKLAEQCREKGLEAEVYPEQKKLGAQFSFAEKKGIPFGIICGEDEISRGTVNLKNLLTRESFNGLKPEEAIQKTKTIQLS